MTIKLDTLFKHAIELAARRGEYTGDMLFKAEIEPDITIYARISDRSEVLIYTKKGSSVYHGWDDFNSRVTTGHFSDGAWVNAIEQAYADL